MSDLDALERLNPIDIARMLLAAEARAEAAEDETARLRAACQEDAAYLAEIDDLVASSGYDPDWNPEYPVTPYTLDCDPKGVLNRLTEHLARLKRIEAAALAWNAERKKINDRSRTGEMRLDILRLTADLDAALSPAERVIRAAEVIAVTVDGRPDILSPAEEDASSGSADRRK